MRIALTLFFCFSSIAHAQNVTTSFNRAVLATNPSAATTRGMAQFALSQTYKTVTSTLKPTDAGFGTTQFVEDAKLNSTELRLTGGHSKIVPELYMGFNRASKESQSKGIPTSKSTNAVQFVDNFLNLGFRTSKRLGLGIKLALPNISFKTERKFFTQDSTPFTAVDVYDQQIIGLTFGSTFLLGKNFYVGAFANMDKSKGKVTGKFLNWETNAPETASDTLTETITRYGAGLSYLNGDSRKHGFRSEISMSQMSKQENAQTKETPTEMKAAMEFAWHGVSFGGSLRAIKAGYYDQSDFIQQIFTQSPSSDDFKPSYGGFLALSSEKGHSFGLYGYVIEGDGDEEFQGIEGKSKTKTTLLNFSYAYLF